MRLRVLGPVLLALLLTPAWAEVSLSHVFGSHMVLQRDAEIPVFGRASAGESVTVRLADRPEVSTTAGDDGTWMVRLPAEKAGGPYTLSVQGANTVTFDDVLVGEVWLCSGQSNMEWIVANTDNAADEIAAANLPTVRHIKVPLVPAGTPQVDFAGEWQVATPQTVAGFTACGFYFARYIQRELGVPVGIINSSWGGTAIEPWTPPVGFASVPSLGGISARVTLADPKSEPYRARLEAYLNQLDGWRADARAALEARAPLGASPLFPQELVALASHAEPTGLYNGMISPLVPYAIRGALWYQGESNHGEGMLYAEKTKALVGGWRTVWGQGEFPFYFVQIAPYHYGEEDPSVLPVFWEAQAAAARDIPQCGMAVITDVGNYNDIHPRNKQDVGKRLALLALARTYGRTDVECSGPTFGSLSLEGDNLRVRLDHAAGLTTRDGKAPDWFEVIGPDSDWTAATATIDGESVVLTAPGVSGPCAMRFAWHKSAEPHLVNGAGLPMGGFRAGEVPAFDPLVRIPDSGDYTLVYDLDLATLGSDIAYATNNAGALTGRFDRVAYLLELQKPNEAVRFAWASMDAFTDDLGKIGIPTLASGAVFQIPVANLDVHTNAKGVTAGTGLAGGNIEFWPCNYGQPNAAQVPNADGGSYDFGDEQATNIVDGYGCLQIHNHEARETILAVNNWKAASNADLGIGNSPGETHDWTFTNNAATYAAKRLRVFVRLVP